MPNNQTDGSREQIFQGSLLGPDHVISKPTLIEDNELDGLEPATSAFLDFLDRDISNRLQKPLPFPGGSERVAALMARAQLLIEEVGLDETITGDISI